MIAFTEKGREIVESLKDITLVEHPFEVVAEGQMKKNSKAKEMRSTVMMLLKKGAPLNGIIFRIAFFMQRVISKIKSML